MLTRAELNRRRAGAYATLRSRDIANDADRPTPRPGTSLSRQRPATPCLGRTAHGLRDGRDYRAAAPGSTPVLTTSSGVRAGALAYARTTGLARSPLPEGEQLARGAATAVSPYTVLCPWSCTPVRNHDTGTGVGSLNAATAGANSCRRRTSGNRPKAEPGPRVTAGSGVLAARALPQQVLVRGLQAEPASANCPRPPGVTSHERRGPLDHRLGDAPAARHEPPRNRVTD
jgi:hypothetical protein